MACMRKLLLALLTLLAVTGAAAACGDDDDGDGNAAVRPAAATVDRFDGTTAYEWVRLQLNYGPRPAGSKASRKLAKRLLISLPNGAYQSVPGGLRNVIGKVPGKDPKRVVVVGAHYDTKDIPDFVGAIDGGSGTAVTMQLATTLKPRTVRPTVVFILFDGEESPAGTPDSQFRKYGLRGSKVAAAKYKRAEAMILLDFVGNRNARFPREDFSDEKLWAKLRGAAGKVGVGKYFPNDTFGGIEDDHLPFIKQGVPAIDLIDFRDFPCWHKTCDDMTLVSQASLDATGEAVRQLLATL
jgi:hypothetical protein